MKKYLIFVFLVLLFYTFSYPSCSRAWNWFNFGEKLGSFTHKLWNKTKRVGSKTWHKVKQEAPKVWHKVKQETPKVWHKVKQEAPKAWHKVKQKAPKVWHKVKKIGKETGEGISTGVKGFIHGWENTK